MTPVLIEGPALEPVSLAEARQWLRLDDAAEDPVVSSLVVAARMLVEAEIGRVLMGQDWRLVGDAWPADGRIPVQPGLVLAVRGGRVFRSAGAALPLPPVSLPPVVLPPGAFRVLPGSDPPQIEALMMPLPSGRTGGIEIDLRLGFGETPEAIPGQIRIALRRLIALWYDRRGDISDDPVGLPPQIRLLLRPFRRLRLGGRP